MATNPTRTLGRVALIVALAAAFIGCSDDDEPTTTTTDAPGETETSDGTLPETDPRIDAVLESIDDSIATFDPLVEVRSASVEEVVIGPVDPAATLDQVTADEICSAVTTVVFSEVPTAVVTVEDGDGTVLTTTEAGGFCTSAS